MDGLISKETNKVLEFMYQKECTFIQHVVKSKMLSSKNKQQLKRIAHSSDVFKINIGKELLNNQVIYNIQNAFNTRELIKISFLKSALENGDKNAIILDLASSLNCDIVQIIGNTVLLYKPNSELKNRIILEK